MGKCKYCNQDAGFFSSYHNECQSKFVQGVSQIRSILDNCFRIKKDFYLEKSSIDSIIKNSNINSNSLKDIYCSVFDEYIELYLDNGVIDSAERATAARFMQFSELSQDDLNRNFSVEKIVQSQVLQEILNGSIPTPKQTIVGEFPFLLSKNEKLIWLFRNVGLHQQKVKKEYVGRSHGLSFRIAKGIYYRVGGFKGRPLETTVMELISSGSVCLTDKNIYFSSPIKSLRIPYNKIINIEMYSNGIGLQKDGASSKPIFLENANGWFCYNIISNLKTN